MWHLLENDYKDCQYYIPETWILYEKKEYHSKKSMDRKVFLHYQKFDDVEDIKKIKKRWLKKQNSLSLKM